MKILKHFALIVLVSYAQSLVAGAGDPSDSMSLAQIQTAIVKLNGISIQSTQPDDITVSNTTGTPYMNGLGRTYFGLYYRIGILQKAAPEFYEQYATAVKASKSDDDIPATIYKAKELERYPALQVPGVASTLGSMIQHILIMNPPVVNKTE